MKKVIGVFALVIAIICVSFKPAKDKDTVNWIGFKELKAQYAAHPKPILIDMYTSWCGWCKEMDRTTYKNQKLVDYINDHYYAVRFDAETNEAIEFNGKTYNYNPRYRANDLAVFLAAEQLEFPTTFFLAEMSSRQSTWSGYMSAKEMEAPLRYYVEGVRAKMDYETFARGMKKGWK